MLLTEVVTLSISNNWDEWVQIFDSKETSELHDRYAMQVLFRGVSPKDPKQVVVIIQAPEGATEQFLRDNREYVESNGAVMDSVNTSIWIG
ncbi:conserved hypothetical protein [Synechococcus sp. CC9311]|nr:conserved hypothetical protein [Synechococcus sp. CC9311]|mmetsp:Transcript_45502/g.107406  ORF Transcript_45502/g.107406 Transcript_45502/m.107406 type:complete len:91 (-) Transcript_45502:944-1216(-)